MQAWWMALKSDKLMGLEEGEEEAAGESRPSAAAAAAGLAASHLANVVLKAATARPGRYFGGV